MANMQFMGVVRAQASGLGLGKYLIMQPNVERGRDLSCGMPVKCLLCSDPGPGIKLLAENGSG